MTVVVLGLDALDPDLVDSERHPALTLKAHRRIGTIPSSTGDPNTHELWPTIITGLHPSVHGLMIDSGGVGWSNPALRIASNIANHVFPDRIQSTIGLWLLNHTGMDTFRTPASYYERRGISTIFDGREAKAIGIPNYVVETDTEDREHQLRRSLGELFERDKGSPGGHQSSAPLELYEACLEMAMIRITRIRRALRSQRYELVFGYTSALDLVGHVSHQLPGLQEQAYSEINEFVGELAKDVSNAHELVIISDHGLKNGVHTMDAMVASTDKSIVRAITSVLDVRQAIESALDLDDHRPATDDEFVKRLAEGHTSEEVRRHLKDLGYM